MNDIAHQEMPASIARELPSVQRYIDKRLSPNLRVQYELADIVQETALVALRSADKMNFDGDLASRAWLRLVASRVLVDLARRARLRSTEDHNEGALELQGKLATPWLDDPLMRADRAEQVELALAQLRDLSLTDRTLVGQHLLQGHSIRQLAEANRCTQAAIRVRLHRAINRLRDRSSLNA